MKVSTNSFAKKTITKGSGFASKTISNGGTVSKKTVAKGAKGWEGENTSEGYFGDDPYSGQAFGTAELGGIAHFTRRTKPTITH